MNSMTAAPLVRLTNLKKRFGKVLAVDDVSLEVHPGEVFGLLGPNGAGKTTTIRMMLGIYQPDAGQIEVLGGPLTSQRADRIGYMPEERGLYPDMQVLNCLTYLGSLKGLSRKDARQRALALLERLELADQAKTRIKTLSRGMTQKVQVIAAVLHQPDLLVIDEPFANLDPVNAQLVRDVIFELRSQGKAVIMTSHQLNLVEAQCDRIALINQGRVVLSGTVSAVRRQFARDLLRLTGSGQLPPSLPGVTTIDQRSASEVYLTLEPSVEPNAVLQAIIAAGTFTVDRFEVDLPSLDEIFIQVVRGQQSQTGDLLTPQQASA